MKQKPTCTVYSDGSKYWWLNGELHRIELVDGTTYWYLKGKFHREDGPAIEHPNGNKSWWLNGKEYNERNYWTKLFELGKISQYDLLLGLL